jgi:hypothetical protein
MVLLKLLSTNNEMEYLFTIVPTMEPFMTRVLREYIHSSKMAVWLILIMDDINSGDCLIALTRIPLDRIQGYTWQSQKGQSTLYLSLFLQRFIESCFFV